MAISWSGSLPPWAWNQSSFLELSSVCWTWSDSFHQPHISVKFARRWLKYGSKRYFGLFMAGNGSIPCQLGAYGTRMRFCWKPWWRFLWPELVGETNILRTLASRWFWAMNRISRWLSSTLMTRLHWTSVNNGRTRFQHHLKVVWMRMNASLYNFFSIHG
jgi:hypothetical protein